MLHVRMAFNILVATGCTRGNEALHNIADLHHLLTGLQSHQEIRSAGLLSQCGKDDEYDPGWVMLFLRNIKHLNDMAYIHTYIHTYVHTYIHTYIHAYIHTYVRTYVRAETKPPNVSKLRSLQFLRSNPNCFEDPHVRLYACVF